MSKRWIQGLLFTSAIVASLVYSGFQFGSPPSATAQGPPAQAAPQAHEALSRASDIQDKHTPRLLANPGVVGTATGLDAGGKPVIRVFVVDDRAARTVPLRLDNVPVVVDVTGEIIAYQGPPPGRGGGGGGSSIDPKSHFERPVPIGVSTGNENECSAGTIGCRVWAGDSVYALSNNHVYARQNDAELFEEDVVQPGRYDTSCLFDSNNVIGTLFAYVPIEFDGSNNVVDAAIALSDMDQLGTATPLNGYGSPSPDTLSPTAALGKYVQKYGRTTALTTGRVTGINATVNVGYRNGTARFVGQMIVDGKKVGQAGDSGSLFVTDDDDRLSVGLLFAGTRSGNTVIVNPIDDVLDAFGVEIDGQ